MLTFHRKLLKGAQINSIWIGAAIAVTLWWALNEKSMLFAILYLVCIAVMVKSLITIVRIGIVSREIIASVGRLRDLGASWPKAPENFVEQDKELHNMFDMLMHATGLPGELVKISNAVYG
jgi:hypothetical protein